MLGCFSLALYFVLGTSTGGKSGAGEWEIVAMEAEAPQSDLPPLYASQLDHASQTARKFLHSGSSKELANIAQRVQSLGGFESVRALRTGERRIVLAIKPRRPILLASSEKELHYVTDQGLAFGRLGTRDLPPDLPILSGVLQEPLQSHSDGHLVLPPRTQQVLAEAAALTRMLGRESLTPESLRFDPEIGIDIVLQGPNPVSIRMGFGPFGEKIQRLKKVLSDLETQKLRAESIELDFEGKAIVRDLPL